MHKNPTTVRTMGVITFSQLSWEAGIERIHPRGPYDSTNVTREAPKGSIKVVKYYHKSNPRIWLKSTAYS